MLRQKQAQARRSAGWQHPAMGVLRRAGWQHHVTRAGRPEAAVSVMDHEHSAACGTLLVRRPLR
jgi:hypothetical protein